MSEHLVAHPNAALANPSLPMKIGLNLWFTDRLRYPRPELAAGESS